MHIFHWLLNFLHLNYWHILNLKYWILFLIITHTKITHVLLYKFSWNKCKYIKKHIKNSVSLHLTLLIVLEICKYVIFQNYQIYSTITCCCHETGQKPVVFYMKNEEKSCEINAFKKWSYRLINMYLISGRRLQYSE